MRKRLSPPIVCVLVYGIVWAAIVLTGFPFDSDPPRRAGSERVQTSAGYCDAVYGEAVEQAETGAYSELAKRGAASSRIKERITEFVRKYGLEKKRVLEVGAGRGYLQDVVEDYTGLDI